MATRHRTFYRLAATILIAFLLTPLAAAQPPWQICGKSGNYAANDTYQSNIRQLSATLPKNASASRTLFATGSVGSLPDIAYALALCRGDGNASACEACVTTAFQDAQQLCAFNKDATVIYDPCYLRFSNQNFLATTSNDNLIGLKNSQSVSSPVDVFDAAVQTLLNATGDYAAANSSRRFATGEEGFDTSNPTIYGLVQCTPDMSPADCRSCLGDIITRMPQRLSGSIGGRLIGVRCNFRYEVVPFFSGSPTLRLPAPPAPPAPPPAPVNVTPTATPGGKSANNVLAIVLPIVAAILAITTVCLCYLRRRRRRIPARSKLPHDSTNHEDIDSIDSLIIDLSTLRGATGNFAEANKLGEGGFGAVYKGELPDGQEIAVKRLSRNSGQGIGELKNELVLVAKLQHKNLVRLVGVCLQEHEKLLVYEYMPNRSIDTILFDPERRKELDWGKRLKIINGIARGLQYLHEDSQLRIIHRDLKASNVLLDSDYTPKISDFGLARLFGADQSREVTNRVVGTYGYMAPEYAMRGHYSIKSDVFSFGILMLEFVTGRRSSGSFNFDESVDLLSLIWEHWSTGTMSEIIDSSLRSHAPGDQMVKIIHIGLLCVQDNPADRPMMSTVNVMLSSNTVSLQSPSKPSFFIAKSGTYSTPYSGSSYPMASQSTAKSAMASPNEVSITELEPR
ncbi:cysteine-rich receptor-like protein kinase 6 isoform X2 [Triticum dicoccoides]|uniref:cysteine-rich receptor-like protein kinase 6 isoform X2 n=1 Tax=Triticum dicoccoides TaxID=85692 RepID=UPI000E7AF0A5|nr:cysteine-rich receptor-like protein kinase 6 isoform X2 [Triticum dicoccoides]